MNPRRKQVLQDAILQMRATREALGPEMMARLQLLVKDFDPALLEQMGIKQDNREGAAAPDLAPVAERPDLEPVDHHKNLLIVMKFLQLKQDNKNIQNQVRMFLAENNSL